MFKNVQVFNRRLRYMEILSIAEGKFIGNPFLSQSRKRLRLRKRSR